MLRRRLLVGLGAISGIVALAGCSSTDTSNEEVNSGSDPNTESSSNSTEDTEADNEEESSLADISVENINLTYRFSSGIRARIQLANQAEEEMKSVYTQIEAFDGDQSLGTDSTWTDITAGFSAESDLTIGSVNSMSDNSIDDVTEFVISGRLDGEEMVEIESLTGEELRGRVDTDN